MKDLMLLISSVMPEEFILKELKAAIAEHEIKNTVETRGHVTMFALMFAGKECSEKAPGGVQGMIQDLDRMQQGMELLNPKKN